MPWDPLHLYEFPFCDFFNHYNYCLKKTLKIWPEIGTLFTHNKQLVIEMHNKSIVEAVKYLCKKGFAVAEALEMLPVDNFRRNKLLSLIYGVWVGKPWDPVAETLPKNCCGRAGGIPLVWTVCLLVQLCLLQFLPIRNARYAFCSPKNDFKYEW